jgi:hypothetical protein
MDSGPEVAAVLDLLRVIEVGHTWTSTDPDLGFYRRRCIMFGRSRWFAQRARLRSAVSVAR